MRVTKRYWHPRGAEWRGASSMSVVAQPRPALKWEDQPADYVTVANPAVMRVMSTHPGTSPSPSRCCSIVRSRRDDPLPFLFRSSVIRQDSHYQLSMTVALNRNFRAIAGKSHVVVLGQRMGIVLDQPAHGRVRGARRRRRGSRTVVLSDREVRELVERMLQHSGRPVNSPPFDKVLIRAFPVSAQIEGSAGRHAQADERA